MAHPLGQESEEFVRECLSKNNYEILAQNKRSPFGEFDLLARNRQGQLVLVEVKSLSDSNLLAHRVSAQQKKRLKNIRLYLESNAGYEVLIVFAFVMGSEASTRKIEWLLVDQC